MHIYKYVVIYASEKRTKNNETTFQLTWVNMGKTLANSSKLWNKGCSSDGLFHISAFFIVMGSVVGVTMIWPYTQITEISQKIADYKWRESRY